MNKANLLQHFNITEHNPANYISGISSFGESQSFTSFSPIDDSILAKCFTTQKSEYQKVIQYNTSAFSVWSQTPAPKRGELVRQIGDALRTDKETLAKLLTTEMGKTYQEALGEVQEMIDICDFAVGLSRQLYGLTMHSERPNHRMYEQYHPLGVVGIISAFNFPVAVWAWNAIIALVCGNSCVWKPSEKTSLLAIAVFNIINKVLIDNDAPKGLISVVLGTKEVGNYLVEDNNVSLVSATGSTKMGREVGSKVAQRFGKCLLELGGNNALIVSENANLELAKRAILFGAIGTSGQRCTTTRRLILHKAVYEEIKTFLVKTYEQLVIGNPLNETSHLGPVIDKEAVNNYLKCLSNFDSSQIIYGNEVLTHLGECYLKPSIVEASNDHPMVQNETFAPILYLIKYSGGIEEAIKIQNDVKQGLSSALFTDRLQEMEAFLSAQGSDCGIANINIGTSGAEIGGAFGGEKETGGGRESGSDAWKAYMRRQTNTINYGRDLPLAQGIKFEF